MQTGIVGLPQVGKTTLFKILTKVHLDAKATQAAMHVGVARVPEPRIDKLAALYRPKKVTHATVQYVDVSGLQKDRARDAAVLAPLREVDALAHVVRVFENPAVPHPAGSIDPLRDATNLDLELMLNDLEQITRRLERVEKDLKKKKDLALEAEQALLLRCKAAIEEETPLRELEFSVEEMKMLTSFMFLSQRPMLFVLNLGDNEAAEIETAVERHKLGALCSKPNTGVVPICGRLEAELVDLEEAEASELVASYGFKESGLDRLIHATYRLLGLTSFFTAGDPEVRAWTIRRGTTAVKAAGGIYSPIRRGVLRAGGVRGGDLLGAGGMGGGRGRGEKGPGGGGYGVQGGGGLPFLPNG